MPIILLENPKILQLAEESLHPLGDVWVPDRIQMLFFESQTEVLIAKDP